VRRFHYARYHYRTLKEVKVDNIDVEMGQKIIAAISLL
jgi:hypothetical protein